MTPFAAAISTETVSFISDGVTIKAFLARPSDAAAQPAVLILHEWWGVNQHIRDIASRFAGAGFVALAPDLYSRLGYKVTSDAAEAARLMNALSSQAALRDLNAAIRFVKTQSFVDSLAIGVVGFCMGGTLALTLATHNTDVKAVVPFYGKVPPSESLSRLMCPVLFHHGAKDDWVTKQEVDRLRDGLAQHHKRGEVRVYPDAGHAFFNDSRPEVYRSADAAVAWESTVTFLRRYLRG